MKKAILIGLLMTLPMAAFAIRDYGFPAPTVFDTVDSLMNFVQIVLNWFFVIIIICAIFYLLYVAIRYILSGGKADVVKGIGSAFGYILLGLLIALIAKGLVFGLCNMISSAGCKIFP